MELCVRDEAEAKKQLEQEWSKLGSDRKRECVVESTIGGDQSYVELLTCVEMSSQWKGNQTGGRRLPMQNVVEGTCVFDCVQLRNIRFDFELSQKTFPRCLE